MNIEYWFWVLGGLAAILAIVYFAKDILLFTWRNRRKIRRAVWARSGLKRDIQKSKNLKVAVAHYPPLSFVSRSLDGKTFEASGPAFDLVNNFAKSNTLKVQVVPLQWHLLKEHLERDGCAAALPIFPSEDRNEFGRVVAKVHSVGLGTISLKSNEKIKTLDSLRDPNIRIAVVEGEVGWEYLRDKFPEKFRSVETIVSKSHDITDTMFAVLQGRADIAITDALTCYRFMQENDPSGQRLHDPFLGQPLRVFDCGFLVSKKEKAFGDWLETELAKLRIDHEFLVSEAKQLAGWKALVSREVPEGIVLPPVE